VLSVAVLVALGFLRSENGGASWHFPDQSQFDGPLTLIATDRHNVGRLYAAGRGVFRSDDFGETWQTVNQDLRPQILAVDASTPERLYVVSGGSIWRSGDAGTSWKRIPTPSMSTGSLVIDSAGTLYTTGSGEVFRSEDAGDDWSLVTSIPLEGGVVAADARIPGVVYAVSCPIVGFGFFSCAIYKTTDAAVAWEGSLLDTTIFEAVLQIESSFTTPRTVYVALSYHKLGSSKGTVLASQDGGANWNTVFSSVDVGAIACDQVRPSVFYVSTLRHAVSRNTVGVYEVADGQTKLLGEEDFAVKRLAAAPDGSALYAIDASGEFAVFQLSPPHRPKLVPFR
jgi:photosystem II stability/assembly factor-like uncharacterized protein